MFDDTGMVEDDCEAGRAAAMPLPARNAGCRWAARRRRGKASDPLPDELVSGLASR